MLTHYSLLSRLQGCLLGLILGDRLGQNSHSLFPAAPLPQSVPDAAAPPWCEIAIDLLQTLTRSHQWHSLELLTSHLQQIPPQQRRPDGLAIATLPITLYFHDDLRRQRQTLTHLCAALAISPLDTVWLLAFAYGLAQVMKGQFDPQTLMPQTLAYLRVTGVAADPGCRSGVSHLEQVAQAQAEMAPFTWLTQTIGTAPAIAIALTGLLQTPDDLRLALARSAQFCLTTNRPDLAIIQALLGALVGAQVGVAGIPPTWQIEPTLAPQVPSLMALADALVASWAGLYTTAIAASVPVTAPWVMRT